jgi:hypothetical protein
VPEAAANHSGLKDFPRFSLPKEARMPVKNKGYDKNQSYDVRKHFGKQVASKNHTSSSCHFGTSTRDGIKKEGVFNNQL